MGTELKIDIVKGNTAPRYPTESKPLEIKGAVITENGMESNLPLIDIVMVDPETGQEHYSMISGRHIIVLAAAIRGVNVRNHGTENP